MKLSLKIPIEYDHKIYYQKADNAKRIYVFLHGFSQTGEFLFKKLKDLVPEDAIIISPNGPFLVPELKNGDYIDRYSWYFYDSKKDNFYINYLPAAQYLNKIIENFNPNNLPVVLIGYSQGGYLAPKVAELCPNVEAVIGLACKFRTSRFEYKSNVTYHQIHAVNDEVIIYKFTKEEFDELNKLGNRGKFLTLEHSKHHLDEHYIKNLRQFILEIENS